VRGYERGVRGDERERDEGEGDEGEGDGDIERDLNLEDMASGK
jgi:hypothetical protein